MKDTLAQAVQPAGSFPPIESRLICLVIVVFLLAVLAALTYFRMKEADEKSGI